MIENKEIVNGAKEYLFFLSGIISDIENKLPEGTNKLLLKNLYNKLDEEFSKVIVKLENILEFSDSNEEKIIALENMKRYINDADEKIREVLKVVL